MTQSQATRSLIDTHLICDIRKDRLVKIGGYFNLQTVTESAVPAELYS